MALIEIGRVCLKLAGRKAGIKVVIVDFNQKGEPIVEGLRMKRKRANPLHLFPTTKKISISKGTGSEEVISKLKQVEFCEGKQGKR